MLHLGPVVQKPVSLSCLKPGFHISQFIGEDKHRRFYPSLITDHLTRIFKLNFSIACYEVEHVFLQIFSGSIELLIFLSFETNCEAQMHKRKQ